MRCVATAESCLGAYTIMRTSVAVTLAVLAMAFAPPAKAATCTASSPDELQQILVEHSPFEGAWMLKGYSGPTILDFRELAGVTYVVWTPSDEHRQRQTPRGYAVSFTKDAVQFRIKSSNTSERFDLNLSHDCRLAGVQQHRNGRVEHDLRPTGTPTEVVGEKAVFASKSEMIAFFTEHSPFKGEWSWSDRKGKSTLTFEKRPSGDLYVTDDNEKDKDTVPVQVLDLNHSTIWYELPGKRGAVHLRLYASGELDGIQLFEDIFALRVTVKPNSQ